MCWQAIKDQADEANILGPLVELQDGRSQHINIMWEINQT